MNTSVTISDGVLTIESLDVSDEVTVGYVSHLDAEIRTAGVVNCLQLGARALTFASDKTGAALLADALKSESEKAQLLLVQVSKTAAESVEISKSAVEKVVGELLDDLSKELSSTLDPANTQSIIGKLRVALVSDYQRVTAKVREDLDLSNPQSPLSALRAELEKTEKERFSMLNGQLNELIRAAAAKEAARSERMKSTRKGGDFETATLDFLSAESRPRKDLVAYTGREYGLDQNFVGDFLIELNPGEAHNVKIVVETKNSQKNGTAERMRELGKAIANRGAVFGISVVTDSGDTTQAIVPFGDDKMIVRVPTLPDGDGWDYTALGIAIECARWKALMARAAAGSLDVTRLCADVDRAVAITNRFTEVKKKITAGKTHLDEIAEYLDDMKRQLAFVLQHVREIVSAGQPKPEAA